MAKNTLPNFLFVCSKNKWRSRTAEAIFKNRSDCFVKSCGTESSAVVKVSSKLISWADVIFVMEKKHSNRLKERFANELEQKEIVILEIEDIYPFMDEELIELLNESLAYYLE